MANTIGGVNEYGQQKPRHERTGGFPSPMCLGFDGGGGGGTYQAAILRSASRRALYASMSPVNSAPSSIAL